MSTSKKINNPIAKLLCDISDPELMLLALHALLSDKELEGVENRLQIFRLLEKGVTPSIDYDVSGNNKITGKKV